jgi:transposase-like protein
MRRNSRKTAKEVEDANTRSRVMELVRQQYTQAEIAAALGIGPNAVYNHVRVLRRQWKEDLRADGEQVLSEAVDRLRYGAQLAVLAFRRSTIIQRRCKACKGTGWQGGKEETGEWCDTCGGAGELPVSGQAGDSSFLRLYVDTVEKIAKLQGVIPTNKDGPPINLTQINVEGDVDLSGVPSDVLLEVRQAFERLKLLVAGKDAAGEELERRAIGYNGDEEREDEG